jgi:hypothetical protein
VFLIANGIAYMHAYKFTHFAKPSIERTSNHLSALDKLKLVFTGVNNPRPINKKHPGHPYQTIKLEAIKNWNAG